MYEKANPSHPDKLADRLAGALVDMAYKQANGERPQCAFEVTCGHDEVFITGESSVDLDESEVCKAMIRIIGDYTGIIPRHPLLHVVKPDMILARNFRMRRLADNGLFVGCTPTEEELLLSRIMKWCYERCPYDGKGLINMRARKMALCLSHLRDKDKEKFLSQLLDEFPHLKEDAWSVIINPIGEWYGGVDADAGAVNRKLGSDMGQRYTTGGGLHGKDASKGDLSVNLYCHYLACMRGEGYRVSAIGVIGSETVKVYVRDAQGKEVETFEKSVAQIQDLALDLVMHEYGGFEKLAEWGLIRDMVFLR